MASTRLSAKFDLTGATKINVYAINVFEGLEHIKPIKTDAINIDHLRSNLIEKYRTHYMVVDYTIEIYNGKTGTPIGILRIFKHSKPTWSSAKLSNHRCFVRPNGTLERRQD